MSALYRDEEGAVRLKKWWGDLEVADPQRQPQKPVLIHCGFEGLQAFETLQDLAQVLATMLEARKPVLVRSVATYDGFDTFPAFTVNALASPGESGGPPAATYLCTIGVQKAKAEDVEAAIAEAQQHARAA